MQTLMQELDSARPAPVRKDDPALLSALAFAAGDCGPFYADDPGQFKVKHYGMIKTPSLEQGVKACSCPAAAMHPHVHEAQRIKPEYYTSHLTVVTGTSGITSSQGNCFFRQSTTKFC